MGVRDTAPRCRGHLLYWRAARWRLVEDSVLFLFCARSLPVRRVRGWAQILNAAQTILKAAFRWFDTVEGGLALKPDAIDGPQGFTGTTGELAAGKL